MMLAYEIVADNTNTALVVVFGGVATQVVASILTWLQSRHNAKHLRSVDSKVEAVKTEQAETKHELNSRLTELVEAVRIAARAAGIMEGIEQQKRRIATGDQGDPDPHSPSMMAELNKVGQAHAKTGTPEDPNKGSTQPPL